MGHPVIFNILVVFEKNSIIELKSLFGVFGVNCWHAKPGKLEILDWSPEASPMNSFTNQNAKQEWLLKRNQQRIVIL